MGIGPTWEINSLNPLSSLDCTHYACITHVRDNTR